MAALRTHGRLGPASAWAPRSGSEAEEKGGGLGADSVSADSAEGGQGRGEGGAPGREKRLAKTHTLLAFWQGQAAK